MHIIFISNVLNTLTREHLKTSSQKYEYDIANSLAKKADIRVYSTCLEEGKEIKNDKVTLCGVRQNVRSYLTRINQDYGDGVVIGNSTVIIFFGYDTKKVLTMLKVRRLLSVKIVPFVFDYHWQAIKEWRIIKRSLGHVYFEIGRNLIKYFDATLLFQKSAARLLNLTNKYFISRPGIPEILIGSKREKNDQYRILFAGSLTSLNGLEQYIYASRKEYSVPIQFLIAGEGPLRGMVEEEIKTNKNLRYLGCLEDRELSMVCMKTDIIVNLRSTDNITMEYSFPSKFTEALGSGIPLISTKVVDDEIINSSICLIDRVNEEILYQAIKKIITNYDEFADKAIVVQEYAKSVFSYDLLADEMGLFLEGLINNESN